MKLSEILPKNSNPHFSALIPTILLGTWLIQLCSQIFTVKHNSTEFYTLLLRALFATIAWILKLRLNESKNEGFITYSLSLAEDRNCPTLPLTLL